ncbi:YbjQ family protein [Spirosoma sp. KCTC 42546]|uniref:YbjQ family protein n=1 Tax=Spirosoma sp. KCTC 42546 TaxID=2520506 RepID=UPI00115BEF48|nr:YbjQ family protein [Spirosoma sp. KCTC 42546]QDK83027.1 YbjQ family protein [Spirosoma sp. KCTC 42546]
MGRLLVILSMLGVTGCFQPLVYLQHKTHYPVDVFYDTQRPERPFAPLQDLEVKGEVPLTQRQSGNQRMLSRGNDMQQKELMLARLTMQAKKLGADALVSVKYTYYTSTTDNGYVMTGLAVKYKKEIETIAN